MSTDVSNVILLNQSNLDYEEDRLFDLVYCDYIYQNLDFAWVDKFWSFLKPNSIFMAQTDDSSFAQVKLKLDSMPNAIWINTCIQIQEWGGVPAKAFGRKHDYILIYANGGDYRFYKNRIQIEKATKNTAFDKKGTGLKTPCDVFYDIPNFSTMSKERIKGTDGKNQRWQKSLSIMNRLFLPFTDVGDWILEPFGGTFSACRWAKRNGRNGVGIEIDEEIFNIGKREVEKADVYSEIQVQQMQLPI